MGAYEGAQLERISQQNQRIIYLLTEIRDLLSEEELPSQGDFKDQAEDEEETYTIKNKK